MVVYRAKSRIATVVAAVEECINVQDQIAASPACLVEHRSARVLRRI
jgi:hypothetical protein